MMASKVWIFLYFSAIIAGIAYAAKGCPGDPDECDRHCRKRGYDNGYCGGNYFKGNPDCICEESDEKDHEADRHRFGIHGAADAHRVPRNGTIIGGDKGNDKRDEHHKRNRYVDEIDGVGEAIRRHDDSSEHGTRGLGKRHDGSEEDNKHKNNKHDDRIQGRGGHGKSEISEEDHKQDKLDGGHGTKESEEIEKKGGASSREHDNKKCKEDDSREHGKKENVKDENNSEDSDCSRELSKKNTKKCCKSSHHHHESKKKKKSSRKSHHHNNSSGEHKNKDHNINCKSCNILIKIITSNENNGNEKTKCC